jgi:hypothetical protein
MKNPNFYIKTLFLLILLLLAYSGEAQTDGLSYQAIIIDNEADEVPGMDITGNYLSNGTVDLLFTITDGEGSILFQEIQSLSTDDYGLVNAVIGEGQATPLNTPGFTEISWDGTERNLLVGIRYGAGGFKDLSEQKLLFVPYAFHRNITATGTLSVDEETFLGGDLLVGNASNTHLTGDLQVDGTSNLQGDLNLSGNALLENDFTVNGLSTFNGDATFNGSTNFSSISVDEESYLNGDVFIGGTTMMEGVLDVNNTAILDALVVNENSTFGGNASFNSISVFGESQMNNRVHINANLSGGSNIPSNYPLCIEGAEQGIYIEVDGYGTNANNYLSFADENGIQGAIEGQTFTDLFESFEYDWEFTLYYIDIAFMTLEGIACSAQFDFGEAGIIATNLIIYGDHHQDLADYYADSRGVYFRSGGADYAEYLPKLNPEVDFKKGDLVGVVGGKITKNTAHADQIMAISSNPIVLGNADGDTDNMEMVAFIGQVPVWTVGDVEMGDYILASGANDGTAIAKSKDEMQLSDYAKILGVAWEERKGRSMSMVNVAVGLNQNDLVHQLEKQQAQIDALQAQMDALTALITGEEAASHIKVEAELSTNSPTKSMETAFFKQGQFDMNEASFQAWLDKNVYVFEHYMNVLKDDFTSRGIPYQKHESIALWVDNPREALTQIYERRSTQSLFSSFLERYPKAFDAK